MFWVLTSMLVILALAGLVAGYVAFPRRGAALPAMPALGDALHRGVKSLPTLQNQGGRHHA